jgi:NAD(P)-dependent dehydrogenase (short-subunit alcohol dehydrogenase family)
MMKGRIVITGASGGMGSAAAEALVRRGYPVTMACRNLAKASAVRDAISSSVPGADIEIREIHLDSAASIREFAEGFRDVPVLGLFNNAGVLPRRFNMTEDGFEQTLAVNYLGPYLLTRLMMPSLMDGGKVVNTVSISCYSVRFDRNLFLKGRDDFHQIRTYALTKLALVYFSVALSQRCSLKVNMSDPGIVDSDMIRLGRWFDPLTDVIFRPFCNSVEKGAGPAVRALCSEERARLFTCRGSRLFPDELFGCQEDIYWLWKETERRLARWL